MRRYTVFCPKPTNSPARISRHLPCKKQLCPFELALDLTNWCDCIVCDYNYLFDPVVSLKRFFTEGGDFIFLIDEAHNLVDRARDMYSAQLLKSAVYGVKKRWAKGTAS